MLKFATISVKEARSLIERGKVDWQAADEKVAVAIARYDAIFRKYAGRLYVQEHDGRFVQLDRPPIRNNQIGYYVTDYYSAVYTVSAKTLEPREHKTAFKAIEAAERAIEKAIDRREQIANAVEECEKIMPRVEAVERNWDELCALSDRISQNCNHKSA